MRITPESKLAQAEQEGWGYDGTMATETEVVHLLTALILVEKPDVVVETGTYSGKGTKAIQAGLMFNEKGRLFTVEKDEEFKYPPLERVHFVRADSKEWTASNRCPSNIDFAFVDCCEDGKGRVEVFKNLWDKINPGGLICIHDTEFYPYDIYRNELIAFAGAPDLHFPALLGFSIWRV